jgi:hypothetical protein
LRSGLAGVGYPFYLGGATWWAVPTLQESDLLRRDALSIHPANWQFADQEIESRSHGRDFLGFGDRLMKFGVFPSVLRRQGDRRGMSRPKARPASSSLEGSDQSIVAVNARFSKKPRRSVPTSSLSSPQFLFGCDLTCDRQLVRLRGEFFDGLLEIVDLPLESDELAHDVLHQRVRLVGQDPLGGAKAAGEVILEFAEKRPT